MGALIKKHLRHLRFLALLIPLFMVCAGMKVPDLSRPQKPKPIWRAVLEETSTKTEKHSFAKLDLDPVIPSIPPLGLRAAEQHSTEALPQQSPLTFLSVSPLPPRAPPASAPLA